MPSLALPDGRALEFEVSGPDGAPVLAFHHGTPSSAVQFTAMADTTHAHGLRLLTWSRAGYGTSDRRPGRDVASETADLAALLDHLGVEDCATAGWSSGGPHALACGALLPDRVWAVLCIASVAPYDAEGLDFLAGMGPENLDELGTALEGEEALRTWMDGAGAALATITGYQIAADLDSILPDIDKAMLTGEFAEDMAAGMRRAVLRGPNGWIDDDLAIFRPWGFDLDSITVPVDLWHGSADLMVPPSHGEWLAAHLPGVTAHLEEGEGHLSLTLGALDRMLDELVPHLR